MIYMELAGYGHCLLSDMTEAAYFVILSCLFFPLFSQYYNPRTDQWTSVSPLPIQRSGFGSAVVDGMLYLAGGCNILSKVNSVDCYDPEKDNWTTVAPMSVRRSGLGVGVAPAFLF